MDRERQQELETPGHGPGKIPLRNKDGAIVDWAIVDLEDEARVREHRWFLEKTISKVKYAATTGARLHAFILGPAANGAVIDHINQDGLNNRKVNLRKVTTSINSLNVKRSAGLSGFRGVRQRGQSYNCRVRYLFDIRCKTALEAAQQYDRILLKLHGTYAQINDAISQDEKRHILEKFSQQGPTFFEIDFKNSEYLVIKTDISYQTFEEALVSFQEYKKGLELNAYTRNLQRRCPYDRSKIARDSAGEAIIEMKNKAGEVVGNAVVDEDIWCEARLHAWYLSANGYVNAMTDLGRICLHNFVWRKLVGEIPAQKVVDHIQNGKDNRANCKLSNLRLNSHAGNSHNCYTKSLTGFRGVQEAKSGNYETKIQIKGKVHYLGTFETAKEAALAYDMKALEVYGEGACLNFPA